MVCWSSSAQSSQQFTMAPQTLHGWQCGIFSIFHLTCCPHATCGGHDRSPRAYHLTSRSSSLTSDCQAAWTSCPQHHHRICQMHPSPCCAPHFENLFAL